MLVKYHLFSNAIVLNQLPSPYFADIASKKKLSSLTPGIPRVTQLAQPETTSGKVTSSRTSTFFYSAASLAVAEIAVVIFRGTIPKQ